MEGCDGTRNMEGCTSWGVLAGQNKIGGLMPKKLIAFTMGALLLFSFLAGCSRLTAKSGNTSAHRDTISNETHTDVITHAVQNNAKKFTAAVEVNASAGSFTWVLTDPNGAVQWNGQVEAGQSYDKSRRLPLTPGTWSLSIDMQGASGSYRVSLNSN
jgi:hypothetical protein